MPVIQVNTRPPRQAAIQNLPHRWITMVMKNSSTLHRCTLLTKCPSPETWYHCGPFSASTHPETMMITREALA